VVGIKRIGRNAALAQLQQSVKCGELLTIVDPPGIGKTVLARSLVDTVDRRRLPGGALLRDLTEAAAAVDVCRVLATELGLPLIKGELDVVVGHGQPLARIIHEGRPPSPSPWPNSRYRRSCKYTRYSLRSPIRL